MYPVLNTRIVKVMGRNIRRPSPHLGMMCIFFATATRRDHRESLSARQLFYDNWMSVGMRKFLNTLLEAQK
jgi:hypothetical protein